jgi:nicotinamidase/pyrazinamidase
LPGGSLAVPRGDEVVPVLDVYACAAGLRGVPVFAARDWHPPRHCSFYERGGRWPAHCVRGTRGAAFASGLRLPASAIVVSKGSDPDRDAYSAFDGTDLDRALRAAGVHRLFVGGLATDYCVLCTVRDALARGYEVVLLTDAIRAIDAGEGARAEAAMMHAGASPLSIDELAPVSARA